MKIRMTIEFNVDDDLWFDSDEKDWFFTDVLGSVVIHSNEIGDTVANNENITKIEAVEVTE